MRHSKHFFKSTHCIPLIDSHELRGLQVWESFELAWEWMALFWAHAKYPQTLTGWFLMEILRKSMETMRIKWRLVYSLIQWNTVVFNWGSARRCQTNSGVISTIKMLSTVHFVANVIWLSYSPNSQGVRAAIILIVQMMNNEGEKQRNKIAGRIWANYLELNLHSLGFRLMF